ncbi:ANTH domain-containing protein [Lasiosphaeria miniovina]|uniref:ANTH domain-containing protein n=1 Tax=Lasiosphaeria miniovina TaxID=1954250 RepID=A0AA40BFX9_9PEZI|nr:ANTH domain-containing protein [Lasiosphaeria miniovina]KAK0733528.1 ANTH domain-containing protein [Lasiosphaeria miniovina]
MASSFEKSVKGATKIKAAPPKTKYIEHILVATHSGEAGVGEVFRALQYRLRDSTWTVVFKSLITVHLMIREGSPDVTLAYLAKHRNMLAVSMFSDGQTQGRNIRHYSNYLSERARAYRETKIDWVRAKEARLEKLSIDKGLLRETETVQHQLTALLKCDVMETEPENEITVTVFRLLVLDLLSLFQSLNQAMINVLGHFFEMSKTDAERAMEIYRTFTRQTDFVVQYLSIARQYEHHTRVEVPKLKHAPVNLGRQLEEYLKDPDFEIHRRQYLAELEAKKSKGGSAGISKISRNEPASKSDTAKAFSSSTNGTPQLDSKPVQTTKRPDADLIDFFESIEQNQTPMFAQPAPPTQVQMGMSPWGPAPFQVQQPTQFAPNGFAPQQTGFPTNSPFQQQPAGNFAIQQLPPQIPQQQMQPAFTGAGFGGFSPQPSFQPSSLAPIPQDSVASFQTGAPTGFNTLQTPQQTTNPFRQSMLMSQQTGLNFAAAPAPAPAAVQQRPLTSQSTNPFARSSPQPAQPFASPNSNSPFQSPSPQQPQQPIAAPLQSMVTGTNPFAKNYAPSQPAPAQQQQRPVTAGGALSSQPTGSTNPFRQGAFVNHATGMGWQHNQTTIGGGLDQVETIPVFPRPAQQTPWQQ